MTMPKKNDEKKLEEIKDNFLQVASHQLKMPLNAIRMNLELVVEEDLGKINDKIKANLMETIKISTKALELVSDYLNASSIDSRSGAEKEKEVDLIDEIREAIVESKFLAKQRNVKVSFSVEPKGLKSLKYKSKNFGEVIKNLISNAIKYGKPGGNVAIDFKRLPGKVVISVKDDGIGIPAADQKRMFSKFFRATNALKKATEGSGLGLYIVKSYVESWGGNISFVSKEKKGTTFIIELPLK